VNFLVRENLKIFTKISYIIALITITLIPIIMFLTSITSEEVEPVFEGLVMLPVVLSVLGIPLSMISMFSTENLVKRIFALILNFLPLTVIAYMFIMEIINEFTKTAP